MITNEQVADMLADLAEQLKPPFRADRYLPVDRLRVGAANDLLGQIRAAAGGLRAGERSPAEVQMLLRQIQTSGLFRRRRPDEQGDGQAFGRN